MKTVGQGNELDGKGFNPPSLLGVNVGAPFLHAGGALTLESLLSSQFKAHHGALSAGFLDDAYGKDDPKLASLVAYLLSIDADMATLPIPQAGSDGGDLCGGL
jgi:hypothetical protein